MVWTGIGAAGVAGALGLGGSLFGANEQKKENRRAFERDFFMWNAQNAYNHPSAQMERLKSAGLNPMLVYGNGSVVGNTTGHAPSYRPADVSGKYSGAGKGFDAYVAARQLHQNLQLGQEQINQVKANTRLLRSQILNNQLTSDAKAWDTALAMKYGVPVGSTSQYGYIASALSKSKDTVRDTLGDFFGGFLTRMDGLLKERKPSVSKVLEQRKRYSKPYVDLDDGTL